MKSLGKLIYKHRDILFLLFLSILVPLLWYEFDPRMLIASHDTGVSTNPVAFVKTRFFTWHSGINLGHEQTDWSGSLIYYGSEALAAYLTGSVYVGQRIIVIFWFFITMWVLYLFIKKTPPFADKPYMALLASILFQFNHYQQHGWRVFWRTRFATYILLPLILILLIDYLEGRRNLFKTALLVGLSVFFLNGGGSPPVFGAPILLVLVTIIYLLFVNIHNNFLLYFKKSIFFVLTSAGFSFVISSFWTFPYLYQAINVYSKTLQSIGGVSSIIAWTDVVSIEMSVLNLLRNVGIPFWDITRGYPHFFFTNPILIIGSFLWPILTLSSIFFTKKREEKKYILLFLLFTVVSLVFSAGTHKPFRDFYIFLLTNIPGFVVFRSPIYKFGNLLWFSYAVLIAFTLSSIIEALWINIDRNFPGVLIERKSRRSEKISTCPRYNSRGLPWRRVKKIFKIIIPALFISLIILWDYPIFNNRFFMWSPPLTNILKIPSYAFELGKWMDENNDYYSRTLLLPDMNKGWSSEIFRWGYSSFGSQLVPFMTDKNTMLNDVVSYEIEGTQELVDKLYDLLKNNNPLWLTLAQDLNIRYLLLRNDIFYDFDMAPTTDPYLYKLVLEKQDKVEKIKSFEQWDLYRIKTDVPAEKVYLNSDPILLLDVSKKIDIYEHLSLVNLKKIEGERSLFLSVNDLPENFDSSTSRSVIVVPGPIEVFLPIEEKELKLPKPKFLPTSPFYFLTERKERELIEKTVKREDLVDVLIDLSLNRLAELDELRKLETDLKYLENTFDRYVLLLNDIGSNLENLVKDKKDVSGILVRTKGFLLEEKKLIKKWINQETSPSEKTLLEKNYQYLEKLLKNIPVSEEQEAVLSGMAKLYYDPDIVFLTPNYKWKIFQSDVYELYVKSTSILRNNDKLIFQIDNQIVEGKIDRKKDEDTWQKIGEVALDEGEHGLQIIADEINLSSFKRYDVVFIKKSIENTQEETAEINYKRLNPTRYMGKISSKNPIYLVLDEKFTPDWRVYLKKQFSEQKVSPKLNSVGKVKKLLDEHLFNTLFLMPLPEEQHFKTNGYANAWFIDPSSYIKGEEFEVIIEHFPQRIFYLGFFVNTVAVGGSIIYLFITRKK